MSDHYDDLPSPEELPELAAALRELDTAPAPAADPARVDDAIRDAARARLGAGPSSPSSGRTLLLPWITLAAAASIAVVVAGVWHSGAAPHAEHAEQAAAPAVAPAPGVAAAGTTARVRGDVNADGTVDIIDAYLVARRVQRAKASTPDPSWDQNHDGRVDQADADAIALSAVALADRSMK